MIQLKQVNDAILDALSRIQVRNMQTEGNRLTMDVEDPEEENPAMVDAIVAAGGRVVGVSVLGSTLEEAYLKLVREDGK